MDGIEIELDDEEIPNAFRFEGDEIFPFFEEDEFGDFGPAFGDNLAEYLTDNELNALSDEILRLIDADIDSRQPWMKRFKRGLELMGLHQSDLDDGPFPGASSAVHPLLAEAMVQFWARALPEMLPSEGPVKVNTVGIKTVQKEERASRVSDYMNYQARVIDKGFYSETSRLLMSVAAYGCAFKKTYYDPALDRVCGRHVPAEDMIIPYGSSTLEESPRYTHRMYKTRNEIRKLQVKGYYVDCKIGKPSVSIGDAEEFKSLKAEATDIDYSNDNTDDARHEILECHIELDLAGFPDLDDCDCETGIDLPYIVTIDRSSRKVLSIYRNWTEGDPLKEKKVYFTKYGYIPGFGIYDFGLFHMIGGLSEAATGALRVLLDGAATASLQGGFKTKEGKRLGEGRIAIEPGRWKSVDVSAEDLAKAFYTPPFKEPSQTLYSLLGFLVNAAQRFSSITEAMVGDADTKSPVGTTVALIEQGSKVFSAIHRGLHTSAENEYRVRFSELRNHIPEEGYPYDVDGDDREVFNADFGPGISVIPVSDPNIFSQTQRIALSQATYQLAVENPGILDRREAVHRLLIALRVPDVDRIMVKNEAMMPLDPISENQALTIGKPVKVFPEQDHMAHIQTHIAYMQHPGFGGNPEAAQMLMPVMRAHLAEHVAALYVQHMRSLGVPAMTVNMSAQNGEPIARPIPPQLADEIGRLAARASAQFMGLPGLPPPQPPEDKPSQEDLLKLKMQEAQMGMQAKEAQHAQKLKQNDDNHRQKMEFDAMDAQRAGERDILAAALNLRAQTQAKDEAQLDKMLDEMATKGAIH